LITIHFDQYEKKRSSCLIADAVDRVAGSIKAKRQTGRKIISEAEPLSVNIFIIDFKAR